MAFELPKLNFEKDALEPYMSKDTVHYHYDKHTKKYFDTTNELIKGTIYENEKSLTDLLPKLKKGTKLYNQATQAWNHQFWWEALTSPEQQKNSYKGANSAGADLIDRLIGEYNDSFENWQKAFAEIAVKQFGSGWAWLVEHGRKFEIVTTSNADRPDGNLLLAVDVWEHAYYLDYQNNRDRYLKDIWNLIDWEIVGGRANRNK